MSEMRIRILHAVPSCGHDSERALRVTAGQRMRPTRTEPTYFMRKGRAEPHLPQQAARPTDATDGIDQRRRRQCACLPRSHAKALTGKKNAQTPASMPAKPLAPSIFGGQKRCIQQSPPWDARRDTAIVQPQISAGFYALRHKPGAQPASSQDFAQALVQPGLPSTRGRVRIGRYFHR